jgi:hypothetical protein
MLDAVSVRAGKVFVGQGFEVRGGYKDRHPDEVVVKEVIEGGEAFIARGEGFWGFEGGVRRRVWEGDLIDARKAEEEVRGERSLDVEVVLAFGELVEELVDA